MGQFGASLGNSDVTDPRQAKWGDLDANERTARIASGLAGGLGKGLQAYQGQQNQTGGTPINPMQFVPQGGPQFSASNLPGSGILQPDVGGGRYSMETPEALRRRRENSAFGGGQTLSPYFYGGARDA